MPGRGPTPKPHRARPRDEKRRQRGTWQSTDAIGWQHGAIPEPPDGLVPASLEAWRVWFGAWFAAHWLPEDLPALRVLIGLYDRVERGERQRGGELRMWCDTFGITPKGQQDRRWVKPTAETQPAPQRQADADPYAHLRVVDAED